MTITDYRPGTAFIWLDRNEFKNGSQFEKICEFLEYPNNSNVIRVPVDSFRCIEQGRLYEKSNI